MIDFSSKTVTVIGLGKSGQAVARLLHHIKAHVKISEMSPKADISKDFLSWVKDNDIAIECGGHNKDFINGSYALVLSPGVPSDLEIVQWARKKNILVVGEIELAYQLCPCPVIAVTGSNGKTTVVTLIREILKKAGKKVCLCGNIGVPFSEHVLTLSQQDSVVLEVSSFQLESIVDFKPNIAVFLNFSENHLDRHAGLQEYFELKKRIFSNQDKNDFAVLNASDVKVSELAKLLKSQVVFFNSEDQRKKYNISDPNFLAAMSVGEILGISPQICGKVFSSFSGVEHRLEKVRTIKGVEFVNDSKATTAEASRWALERVSDPIIWICGGRDKNIDFSVLKGLAKKKVKTIVAIGEAKEKIKRTFEDVLPVVKINDMEEAVEHALKIAVSGDCVVLSPMCSSFDMFRNFEERGKVFKDIVMNLSVKM